MFCSNMKSDDHRDRFSVQSTSEAEGMEDGDDDAIWRLGQKEQLKKDHSCWVLILSLYYPKRKVFVGFGTVVLTIITDFLWPSPAPRGVGLLV